MKNTLKIYTSTTTPSNYLLTEEDEHGNIVQFYIATDAQDAIWEHLNLAGIWETDLDYLPAWHKTAVLTIEDGEIKNERDVSFWAIELKNELIFYKAERREYGENYEVRELPEYALPYFINGDETGLDEDQLEIIEDLKKDGIAEITTWSQEPTYYNYYKCVVRIKSQH